MKVLITGGTGFLGTALAAALVARGHDDITRVGRQMADFRSRDQVMDLFNRTRPDWVFHLAATVAGIGGNRRAPATLWRENLLMGIHALDACVTHNVGKMVLVGTTCSYPKVPPRIPFQEEDIFSGYPEETNAPYGIAKTAVHVGARAYAKQFGLHVVTAIPTNLYGPGDNFDPNTSHVIPAIIRKVWKAINESDAARSTGNHGDVEIWGSGRATRDFLFVHDAAKALVLMMEKYEGQEPINLGSGQEVNIRQVASMVGVAMGFNGGFVFNPEMPDGQPRRCLSTVKAIEQLGWEASTPFSEGLIQTCDWYSNFKGNA